MVSAALMWPTAPVCWLAGATQLEIHVAPSVSHGTQAEERFLYLWNIKIYNCEFPFGISKINLSEVSIKLSSSFFSTVCVIVGSGIALKKHALSNVSLKGSL